MPFNGTGTFTRVYSWVIDQANGIFVRADRTDTDSNDIASGLSNCITKDGQQILTANIPFAGFKITGLGTGVGPADSVNFAQVFTAPAFTGAVSVTGTLSVSGALTFVGGSATGAIDYSGATTFRVPTATPGDTSTLAANTAFLANKLTSYAPLASPAFTAIPTAPTAAVGTNTTQLATMAAIMNQVMAANFPGQSAATAGKFAQSQGASQVVVWAAVVPSFPTILAQGGY